MARHCENCYCDSVTINGLDIRIWFIYHYVFGNIMFMVLGGMMLNKAMMNKFPGWSEKEQLVFLICFVIFGIIFTAAVFLKVFVILELLRSIMYGIYLYILDFLTYLCSCLRLSSLQSMLRQISRQSSSTESDEVFAVYGFGDEPQALPPINRFTLRGENPPPLQECRVEIEPTPGTSGHPVTDRSGSRSRKCYKRKIREIINLKTIEEESDSSEDLSDLEFNVSVLVGESKSSGSISQEQTLSTNSDTADSTEKAMTSDVKDIQKKQSLPEQTPAGYVGFSELEKQQHALKETKKRENSLKKPSSETCIRFSELQRQERISDTAEIQRMQNPKSREETSATGYIESSEAQTSGIQMKPDSPERTSATGYVSSSRLQTLERTLVREDENTEQTTSAGSSILLSAIPTAVGSPHRNQKNEITPEETSSSSGLVSRLEQTLSQEAETQSAGVERCENIQTSSRDNSSASSQGAVSNEAAERESVFSLNLSGGSVVLSSSTDGLLLSSDTDPCGSAFFYDQPENVLDLSHIEVPIILPQNEPETRDDN